MRRLLDIERSSLNDHGEGVFHVIDMKLPESPRLSYTLFETATDKFLCDLFLSIIAWQQELGILDLFWVVNCDEDLAFLDHGRILNTHSWHIVQDTYSLFAANETTLVGLAAKQPMALVDAVASSGLARDFPEAVVIRVLRVTPNPMRADLVRHVTTSRIPKNMYCLWIREESSSVWSDGGSFRELDPNGNIGGSTPKLLRGTRSSFTHDAKFSGRPRP